MARPAQAAVGQLALRATGMARSRNCSANDSVPGGRSSPNTTMRSGRPMSRESANAMSAERPPNVSVAAMSNRASVSRSANSISARPNSGGIGTIRTPALMQARVEREHLPGVGQQDADALTRVHSEVHQAAGHPVGQPGQLRIVDLVRPSGGEVDARPLLSCPAAASRADPGRRGRSRSATIRPGNTA